MDDIVSVKCIDYADDICLLTHRVIYLGQMILHLKKEADRVGLNMNTNKLNQTGHGTLPICINGQNIEGIISLSRNPSVC